MFAPSSTRRRWLVVGLAAYGPLGLAAASLVVALAVAESAATVLRWLLVGLVRLVGLVLLVAWPLVPALIALDGGIALLRPVRAAAA